MAITRSATSRILVEIKDKLRLDDIFGSFSTYTMTDLEETKYPEMPFIAVKATERDVEDVFTRSIRGMLVDVLIVIHAKKTTHPNDATMSGWDYATWLAETMTNFLNAIDFGDDPWVIERDCQKDVDDGELGGDLVYTITVSLDMMFETTPL